MKNSPTDLEQRARSGDPDALAQYLDARREQLRGYVERKMSANLRQKTDAEDLLQEIILSCIRAQPNMDLRERDLFGWVCQVAQRRIIDAGRKYSSTQKRDASREVSLQSPVGSKHDQQQGLVDLLVASVTSPSQAFSRNQREFHLLAALDELPEDQRQALTMRYIESRPTKEIAATLGKSDGAVRVMLTRSLRKLEDALRQLDDFTQRLPRDEESP